MLSSWSKSVALFLIFADNLQIYGHSVSADTQELVAHMTTCIERVRCWMASNRIRLNPTKTELIWLRSSRRTNPLSTSPIRLFGTVIGCSLLSPSGISELSLTLDLSLSAHVSHITSVSFYYLRLVRRSLTMDAVHALVRAMIHSRLDYCNSLLADLPIGQMSRLQSVLRAIQFNSIQFFNKSWQNATIQSDDE